MIINNLIKIINIIYNIYIIWKIDLNNYKKINIITYLY